MITHRLPARLSVMLAALLSLSACTGAVAGPTSAPIEPARSSSPGGAVLAQLWATAPLVDVATGESFRIADLAGKVVILEIMAIWCTNCRFQQASVEEALTQLPPARVVYVLLDIDPNEDADSLAAYRKKHGYTGRYAIASADVARALADEFGNQVLSPPSTPIVVVSTDGTVTRTDFGQKSSEDIVALALAGGA